MEKTFQEYLEHLWQLMDEVWRVLKNTGTAWINLGDTYGTKSGNFTGGNTIENKISCTGTMGEEYSKYLAYHKCLLLIPHRFAIGCIDRGWIMRNDIVWAKRNGMPESVTDRFSKKHEYFFFMAKQEKYYFNLDAIRGKQSEVSIKRYQYDFTGQEGGLSNNFKGVRLRDKSKEGYANAFLSPIGKGARPETNINGKNPGSVSDFWGHKQTFEEYMKVCEEYYYTPDDFLDIPTQPSSTQHYAAYNTKLISKPILAGSPKGGIILDPFCGTGTTGILALDLRRRFIGIEGKEEYCKIANKNISLIKRQASIDFDDLIVK